MTSRWGWKRAGGGCKAVLDGIARPRSGRSDSGPSANGDLPEVHHGSRGLDPDLPV
jgi:hypothetical protein